MNNRQRVAHLPITGGRLQLQSVLIRPSAQVLGTGTMTDLWHGANRPVECNRVADRADLTVHHKSFDSLMLSERLVDCNGLVEQNHQTPITPGAG